MILSGIDTSITYEAMKRGEWPEPNPQVAEAWERLGRLDFPIQTDEAKGGKPCGS